MVSGNPNKSANPGSPFQTRSPLQSHPQTLEKSLRLKPLAPTSESMSSPCADHAYGPPYFQNIVGIICLLDYHTKVMSTRSIIALLLGLVMQLSHTPSCGASELNPDCPPVIGKMDCCKGQDTCPCAKKSEPPQKQSPAIPASNEAKWIISKIPNTDFQRVSLGSKATSLLISINRDLVVSGYQGVSLSVAFCRYVI